MIPIGPVHTSGRTPAVLPALFSLLLSLAGSARAASGDAQTIDDFLSRHWARPLAAQGEPPEKFSALEASLAPADCGVCHVEQYRDWQTTLHSRAVGPGLTGQLVEMPPQARDEHQQCLRCHAPLAEQADTLVEALATPAATERPRTASASHTHGLSCAGCHVRQHQRFGPPRRDGGAPAAAASANLPHGGFTATPAFEDSRFCSSCHQFAPDGFGLNGKLLENTFEEWKSSRHAREGKTCQSCHMPERRHLWRGIHDAEMVRAAVDFIPEPPTRRGRAIRAALIIRNTGAGHFFPTYVTPRVSVEIEQLSADGRPIPGSRVARPIQRRVPLDLSREIADTRLPPDGELRLVYERRRATRAVALVYRLRVEPDEYYVRFYHSLLKSGSAGRGTAALRAALKQAEASGFVAFEETRALP